MHGLKRLVKRNPKEQLPSDVLDGLAFADMAISRLRAETDPAAPDTVFTNSLAAGSMNFQVRCHTAGACALATPACRLRDLAMRGLQHLLHGIVSFPLCWMNGPRTARVAINRSGKRAATVPHQSTGTRPSCAPRSPT